MSLHLCDVHFLHTRRNPRCRRMRLRSTARLYGASVATLSRSRGSDQGLRALADERIKDFTRQQLVLLGEQVPSACQANRNEQRRSDSDGFWCPNPFKPRERQFMRIDSIEDLLQGGSARSLACSLSRALRHPAGRTPRIIATENRNTESKSSL